VQQVADIKPLNSSDSVDERGFADLIKPLIAPGFKLAFAMLHDAASAEDVVQEACFTAWRQGGFDSRPGPSPIVPTWCSTWALRRREPPRANRSNGL
jgi:DNA-directed RNA polymerase specialized sigma24 family protein